MKRIILLMVLCLSIFLTACGQKSAIQEATGANSQQNVAITEKLEGVGIYCEMINKATHNKPDEVALAEGSTIYNVIDSDAVNYFLVLDADLDVLAILDDGLMVLYVIPEFYEPFA